MAVTPRNFNFKHKLITHKIKVDPRMCAQSVVVRKMKTRHLTASTSRVLHDIVKSYIHMCFKYFRWSERTPQMQRSANMKTSYVCHQLHRWVCTRARQRHHLISIYYIQTTVARRACIQRATRGKEATTYGSTPWPPPPNQLKSITAKHTYRSTHLSMKHTIPVIKEYTYTCDTQAHTSCEEGAAVES